MTTDVTPVADALKKLGFTAHSAHPAAKAARVKALSHNGEYKVLGAWQKDNVLIHVEQNTAPETIRDAEGNEFTAQSFTYPPVIVIETLQDDGSSHEPPRTLAVSYGDLEALHELTKTAVG